MKNGKKVVIGVIGSDCHAVGNKIIHHVLESNGFEVINIGVLSPQIDFINAAIETKAAMGASDSDATGYFKEGYAFSPMFTLGYTKTLKDKEVFSTWLSLEKAN